MTQGNSILRTRHWRNVVRPAVLARDGGMCQVKLPGEWTVVVGKGDDRRVEKRRCMVVADCVHHTRGIATGFDMRYLLAACTPCNTKIGDPRKHGDPPAKTAQW
jgi:hypothetical protein